MLPQRQADETNDAYAARIEQDQRNQQADWLRQRQADGLGSAEQIFIARKIDRPAPVRRLLRSGRPIPAPPVIFSPYSPIYFQRVDTFRGRPSRSIFRVRTSNTTCGPMSLGDTMRGDVGALYVFFAHAGAISEDRLIDAIAVDTVNNPALLDFVARYRGEPAMAQPAAN